jgi:tetratricopeptide (TPR) repeat protein
MPSGQESFTSLLDRATAELYAAGKIEEAIKEATNRLAEARRLAEEDDADPSMLPNALEVLAEFHREHGDFEKSESMYIEAIDLVDQKENSRQQRGRLHSGLGTLYDFNQREEQAVPHYEKAIEDFEALTPPRSNEAAQLRNNLAMIYKSLGRHPLAEQHYLMALETLENLYGGGNERVGAVYNNLGSLYYTAGFPDQAKEMHMEALRIRQEIFGPDHPEVAQSFCNLATACYELEDFAGMQENYDQGLSIYEKNPAASASSYEAVAADYAKVLESIGEEKKAQIILKRSAKVLKAAGI